jgi:hypothetical protein
MKKSVQTKIQNHLIEADEYTNEELESLDYYHDYTGHIFEDEEIYELMRKFDNDESKIKVELDEKLKIANKGDEYKWHEVGKSKNIF